MLTRSRSRPARLAARLTLAAGALLPLALLAPAGCQYDASIAARRDAYAQPWLTLGSAELRNDIVIGEPIRNRDEAHLLFVSVPVRNTTDRQIYVQGTMTFYDQAGNAVGLPIHRTITIPSHQSERFDANSTSPSAETFHLGLNYPRVE